MTGDRYRFHLLSLPWTHTIRDARFSWCAYTQRVVRFADMMTARGHEVILYSGEENDAACTEHVVAITPGEQAGILGTREAPWDPAHPAWVAMNTRAADQIRERAEPTDFLLMTCGPAQQSVANANPTLTDVEYGIGYHHTSSRFRVFESYAWMHTMYAAQQGTDWNGRNGDVVIPNYFNPDDFWVERPELDDPYFLYIGRGITRKGVGIAAVEAERAGARLIIAGDDLGGYPDYGHRVGVVGPAVRGMLMARAAAVFVPTQYGGPFEGVCVEALLSGAPVITTDWGCFAEHVQPGDGWRCRTTAEFAEATRRALNSVALYRSPYYWWQEQEAREDRRRRAAARWSYVAVAPLYERYFDRLTQLWGEGWTSPDRITLADAKAITAGRPAAS